LFWYKITDIKRGTKWVPGVQDLMCSRRIENITHINKLKSKICWATTRNFGRHNIKIEERKKRFKSAQDLMRFIF